MQMRPFAPMAVALSLFAALFSASPASAISEKNYATNFLGTVMPFLRSGQEYTFQARDGESLSGVKFIHPNAKGTILIVPGRSEPWLKYGEVFYDLYQKGYSLYSYDHRGQGKSRHLVEKNRQIGHIDDYGDYTRDLEDFVAKVLVPAGDAKLYLLAHSMGGGIAANYLSRGKTPFKAAVLNCPMLKINTKPYSIAVAKIITGGEMALGKAEGYAHGRGDFDPNLPFEKNDVTGSPERFWMTNAIYSMFPTTIIGGPSNAWVYRTLKETPKFLKRMKTITTPTIMFQAGQDKIVMPDAEIAGCASTKACRLVRAPTANHEILMESDAIRDPALRMIEDFFQ